jgi:hypothetical protein
VTSRLEHGFLATTWPSNFLLRQGGRGSDLCGKIDTI